MADLNSVKKEIAAMAELTLKMLRNTFATFMEHDLDILSLVLKDEDKLNDLEKELTTKLIEVGRALNPEAREEVIIYREVVADLELIGDYCKDILERVQIKIEEKLLFTEEAVKEYEELYHKTESALAEITFALEKDSPELVNTVLKREEHIDSLVDTYRSRHTQRMLDGVCSPMDCNMFLNMLDFTAAIYYHAKKIARNLLKIKQ